jgi:hypothetical protein
MGALRAIWISVGGHTNKLVQVDPMTGQIKRTMSSPSDLGPVDLDFFQGTLWLSSGTGTIFALDPTTGGIDHMLSVPSGFSGRDYGVAVRASEIWIGALFGGMCVEDPVTGAALSEVVHDDGTQLARAEIGASLFIGSQLVTATGRGITYYDVN